MKAEWYAHNNDLYFIRYGSVGILKKFERFASLTAEKKNELINQFRSLNSDESTAFENKYYEWLGSVEHSEYLESGDIAEFQYVLDEVQVEIDSAFDAYRDRIQALADKTFEAKVLPVLKRRNWALIVTQRNWVFGPDSHRLIYDGFDSTSDDDDRDVRLLISIMNAEVHATRDDIGMWMPSWKPEN